MIFYSVGRNGERPSPVLDFDVSSPVTEHRTVARISQIVGTAIGRWLISGLDCPDMNATDGISEVEGTLLFESSF